MNKRISQTTLIHNQKSPAFQFYPAEWLSDEEVGCLSLAEEGLYIRAICYCWREGSIPADENRLAKLLGKGATTEQVKAILHLFQPTLNEPSRLVNNRLEKEREKQARFRAKCSVAGTKSAESRQKVAKKQASSSTSQLNQPTNVGSVLVQPKANSLSSSLSSSSIYNNIKGGVDTSIYLEAQKKTPTPTEIEPTLNVKISEPEPPPPDRDENWLEFAKSQLVDIEDPAIQAMPEFVNAGRRPMKKYPEIKIAPHELDEVFQIHIESGVPQSEIYRTFRKVVGKLRTIIASGKGTSGISVYNWLIGWALQDTMKDLKLSNDMKRSEKYLTNGGARR